MAAGADVVISAVAYYFVSGRLRYSWWKRGRGARSVRGSLRLYFGDLGIGRSEGKAKCGRGQDAVSFLTIVLGTVVDGLRESIVLGLSLLEAGGFQVLRAR